MPTSMSRMEVESQSNRNFDSYRRSRIEDESKSNRSRIAIVIAALVKQYYTSRHAHIESLCCYMHKHTSILTQQENVSENCDVTFVISIENPESIFINDVQMYSVQKTCSQSAVPRCDFYRAMLCVGRSVTLVDCVHMVRPTIIFLHHMVVPSF